ncbi:unnamed protein product [Allacma fusca]|uniref:C2H2-type domain-containing protein n=1 Tax=Allacma fusca TaxID=39272 RepID=A0A8J2NT10_9HEXA|nr:unnamed protein product [Allacma fusca]
MRPKGLVETKLNKKVRRIEETVKLWESRLENIENEHKSTLSNYTEKIRRLEVRYKNLKRRFKSSEARVKDLAAKLSLSTSSCDSEEAGEFQEGFENHEEIGTENVVIDPKAHQDGSSSFEEDAVVKRRKRDKPSRVKNSEDDPGWHLSEKVLRMSDAINVTFPPTTKNFQDECGEPVILLQAVKIPDPMVDLGSNIDAESATESSFKCHFCQKSKKSMFKLIVHLRKHTGCEPPILNSERMEKSQRGELDRPIRSLSCCHISSRTKRR